jgi:Zinc-finger domain of monoamine-oxidase A repressor R1
LNPTHYAYAYAYPISIVCRDLFVDGYDAQGNRVYDKVEGQTCHQCRQKTMGKRTSCSQCQSLSVRL